MQSTDETTWKIAHQNEQWNWNHAVDEDVLGNLRQDSVILYTDMLELPRNTDLTGKYILDIGGGYTSLLTAFQGKFAGVVVDPADKKDEVIDYYKKFNVIYIQATAEEYLTGLYWKYDEVWMYNVLKHTFDPELIMRSLPKAGKVLRIAELTDTIQDVAHPHILTKEWLTDMLKEISTEGNYHEEHRDVLIHPDNTPFHLDSFGGVFKLKETP